VSHDRHLVELTADRLILVASGTAAEFAGSFEDYRDLVLRERDGDDARAAAPKRATRRDERRQAAEARERTQPLRDAVKRAEAEIARLTAELRAIDQTLLTPARNGAGPLLKTRAELERTLAAAESRWLAASEALERAEGA